MKRGTVVEVTIDAGAVPRGEAGYATKTVATVTRGTRGRYDGPCPGKLGREDWHVIAVNEFDVPLHVSQFREVQP